MKRNRTLNRVLNLLVVISMLLMLAGPALAEGEGEAPPEAAGTPAPASSHAQAGTTLSAEKTATGFWERRIVYDWEVEKVASPTSLELLPGESGWVEYWIYATRTKVSEVDAIGVRGQICVTNGGDRATEGLKLVDQVEYKTGSGPFQPLAGASQTIIPASQLGPGGSECYNYEIEFSPVAGAIYRNTVKVTITNHSGWLPGGQNCPGPGVCDFGPEPKAGFSLPSSPAIIEIDEHAHVSDALACPAGFSCSYSDAGPWHFTGSGSVHYSVEVRNVSAVCGSWYDLHNTVTLRETDTNQLRYASAHVEIYAECPGYCTKTIGYWKTHAGFHGRNADYVTPLLPVWLGAPLGAKSVPVTSAWQALWLLSMSGDASNGINKLYAQLLGARLNIASGADGSAVAGTIAAADAFLATRNSADWNGLSKAHKSMVLGWMTTLDRYNNGLIGPGHCP